jgi:hypothetical protein
MASTGWNAPVYPLASAAGSAVTAAALTAATPAPAPVIGGGTLNPGTRLILEADLEMTSTSATPTLTLGFYIGAVAGAIGSATLIAATPAQAMSASAAAWPIKLRFRGRIVSLSPTVAVIQGTGELLYGTSLTAWTVSPFPATAAARTVSTLNTSQNNQLDVGVTLSSTTGSPSVTCTDFHAVTRG